MTLTRAALTTAAALLGSAAFAADPAYFTAASDFAMKRDDKGVLLVTINDGAGGPITLTAKYHTEFIEGF